MEGNIAQRSPSRLVSLAVEARNVTRRVGYKGVAIGALSTLALTGCAAQENGSPEATATPTPSATSVELNSLSAAQQAEIEKDCPQLENNSGYLAEFPYIPESKAKLVFKAAQIGACDAAGLIVTDYANGTQSGK